MGLAVSLGGADGLAICVAVLMGVNVTVNFFGLSL